MPIVVRINLVVFSPRHSESKLSLCSQLSENVRINSVVFSPRHSESKLSLCSRLNENDPFWQKKVGFGSSIAIFLGTIYNYRRLCQATERSQRNIPSCYPYTQIVAYNPNYNIRSQKEQALSGCSKRGGSG